MAAAAGGWPVRVVTEYLTQFLPSLSQAVPAQRNTTIFSLEQ